MDKHLLLSLALFLLFTSQALSQDSFEPSIDLTTLKLENSSGSQGIYNEPRWVSWPGTAININLFGFAQAGPVFQLEIRTYKSLYLVPSFRYNYAGYASHRLMNGLDTDSRYLPGSFGAGLGIKQFFALQKKNNLISIGLFGEYSTDKATYNMDSKWESERVRNAVNVVGNVGYRWWMRKNFFLHVGIYAGVAIELKDESRYTEFGPYQGELETDFKNTPFIGLIDLALGWNL